MDEMTWRMRVLGFSATRTRRCRNLSSPHKIMSLVFSATLTYDDVPLTHGLLVRPPPRGVGEVHSRISSRKTDDKETLKPRTATFTGLCRVVALGHRGPGLNEQANTGPTYERRTMVQWAMTGGVVARIWCSRRGASDKGSLLFVCSLELDVRPCTVVERPRRRQPRVPRRMGPGIQSYKL